MAICLLFLFFAISPSLIVLAQETSHATHPFAGKRAILDGDIPYWTDKTYIDRTLQRVKDSGFNVYMPTVWQGRGTAWPSQYAPWDSQLRSRSKQNFDPLKYLIDKAHQLGIEVHPWFTLTLRQADIFPEFAAPGTPEKAFDVHNKNFRHLIASLVSEVVDNYDVDGVNLDYVRAMGLCTNADCKREYREIYGRDLELDTALFKLSFGKVPSLVEYQENAVTSMIATVSDKVRKRKPNIMISVDTLVGQISAEQGQNSVEWANKGLIDVVFRMDYMRQLNTNLFEDIRRRLNNPGSLSLLISNMSTFEEMQPGQKHFPRDGRWLAKTVSLVQSRWPEIGIAIYFYKYLTDEQIDALKGGPFRTQEDHRAPLTPSNIRVQ
ncbi:MAG: hypothetical protein CV089_08540 [Nitrospira sp. WS110]|nr:hypothetical protein [Nitrospira sp. WS110]